MLKKFIDKIFLIFAFMALVAVVAIFIQLTYGASGWAFIKIIIGIVLGYEALSELWPF